MGVIPIGLKRLALATFLPWYMVRLKRSTRQAKRIPDYMAIAFNLQIHSLHIKPFQVQSELKNFLELLAELRPRRILEIGTARGGTLYLFSRIASDDAVLISLDLPGATFGGGYPLWKIPLYRSYAEKEQKIHLLRGDSHAVAMVERVYGHLHNDLLDFLFIDGDHRYEGVKRDFELYSPLVRPGGVIAFHDIVPGPEKRTGGVPQFWQEVKTGYEHDELVESWQQGGFGLGILRMPTAPIEENDSPA